MIDPKSTRGYLNNNPGNMDRLANDTWQGEIRDAADTRLTPFQLNELTHGRFSVFEDAVHGYRALAKNILYIWTNCGDKTIRQIIGVWAPPNENNTEMYTNMVCKRLGVNADDAVDPHVYDVMYGFADAITRVELGGMPYMQSTIDNGLALAGVVKEQI